MDATRLDDTMISSVMGPLSINIQVVTTAKLGEHLRLGKVSQTFLVDSGPVNNWDWRTYVRNSGHWSWTEQIRREFENIPQLWVDLLHHSPELTSL